MPRLLLSLGRGGCARRRDCYRSGNPRRQHRESLWEWYREWYRVEVRVDGGGGGRIDCVSAVKAPGAEGPLSWNGQILSPRERVIPSSARVARVG
jgi:hypothetical protein